MCQLDWYRRWCCLELCGEPMNLLSTAVGRLLCSVQLPARVFELPCNGIELLTKRGHLCVGGGVRARRGLLGRLLGRLCQHALLAQVRCDTIDVVLRVRGMRHSYIA